MKLETKQKIWAVILTLGLIIFFATGCKTRTILVPVKETKIEYRDRLRVDSIYNRDTVEVYGVNDTIFKNVIKWRERFKVDTLTYFKTDSVPVIVEVEKYTNQLTKWQRWRLNALNVIVAGLLVWLFFFLRRLF